MDKLKIQESEILLILYELRTKILKSDLDGKYKDPIAKQLDDSAELIKDQFATEYWKIRNIGNIKLQEENPHRDQPNCSYNISSSNDISP